MMLENQMVALLREAVQEKRAQYVAHSVRAKLLKRSILEGKIRDAVLQEASPAGGLVMTQPTSSDRVYSPMGGSISGIRSQQAKTRSLEQERGAAEEGQGSPEEIASAVNKLVNLYNKNPKNPALPTDLVTKIAFLTSTAGKNTYAGTLQGYADTIRQYGQEIRKKSEELSKYEKAIEDLVADREESLNRATEDYSELEQKYKSALQAADQAKVQELTAQSLIDFIKGPGYQELSDADKKRVRSAFREYVTGETRRRRERRAAARSSKTA